MYGNNPMQMQMSGGGMGQSTVPGMMPMPGLGGLMQNMHMQNMHMQNMHMQNMHMLHPDQTMQGYPGQQFHDGYSHGEIHDHNYPQEHFQGRFHEGFGENDAYYQSQGQDLDQEQFYNESEDVEVRLVEIST